MMKFTATLFLALSLIFMSCGEEGIGFNVSKEFPVDVPIDLPIPGNPLGGLIDVDPEATSFDYDLSEVGGFDDALGELNDGGDVVVNNLAYEITGVDADEELDLDELSISINLPSGAITIPLAQGTLSNLSKTDIPLTETQKASIVDELLNNERIDADVVFDLAELPADPNDRVILFDFVIYFDVTLKARNL